MSDNLVDELRTQLQQSRKERDDLLETIREARSLNIDVSEQEAVLVRVSQDIAEAERILRQFD